MSYVRISGPTTLTSPPALCLYKVALVRRIDKIYVSFSKEPYERDNILQKRHVNLSILLTVATP